MTTNKKNDLRLRPVFNIEKAKELMKRGHECHGCELNHTDTEKVVFYFERNGAVHNDLLELNKK